MFRANRLSAFPGLAALIALCCSGGNAQMTTGSLGGTVVDASEALIPNAVVTIVNEGTGETRKSVTSAAGEFLFTAVQAGTYTVSMEKAGFRRLKLTGV